MKTPLRGEMLRGADFIIGVVSARGSDPLQTVFCVEPGPQTTLYTEAWYMGRTFLATGRQARPETHALSAF